MSEWKSVKNPPERTAHVILYWPEQEYRIQLMEFGIYVAGAIGEKGRWLIGYNGDAVECDPPTHWMYRPRPPMPDNLLGEYK